MNQKQLICTYLDLFRMGIMFQMAKNVLKQLLQLYVETLIPFLRKEFRCSWAAFVCLEFEMVHI